MEQSCHLRAYDSKAELSVIPRAMISLIAAQVYKCEPFTVNLVTDEHSMVIDEYIVARDTALLTAKGPIHLPHQKFYILNGTLPDILIGDDILKAKLALRLEDTVADLATQLPPHK